MKISVVIPTYNREKTIKDCIMSILAQTYQPYEIIIVDDASTDGTVKIVENISSELIKIYRQPGNKGAQAARNRGILEAKGDWIAFQDSDDLWIANKLERQVDVIREKKSGIVYTGAFVQKVKNGQPSARKNRMIKGKSGNIYRSSLVESYVLFQTMLVEKKALLEIGLLDEKVKAYQEWDTTIRLAKKNKFYFISDPLFIYNLHDGETISKNILSGAKGKEYIVEKNKKDIVKFYGKEKLADFYLEIANMYFEAKKVRSLLYILKYVALRLDVILGSIL